MTTHPIHLHVAVSVDHTERIREIVGGDLNAALEFIDRAIDAELLKQESRRDNRQHRPQRGNGTQGTEPEGHQAD